ncbi:MAG: iron-containing alcohol dehydrogenase, partial [Proteobacteria bacterium]|nr:iron-containing alcohol dehydrogenase [Pseudomonadota bacterium]
TPTVLFGRGVLAELPDQLRRAGAGKAFIVTDAGIVGAGILAQVEGLLNEAGVGYDSWTEVQPEPPSPSVDACAAAIKAAAADVVVGLGGGSAMDTSQIAACLVTNGGKAEDWLGVEVLEKPGIPTISVPTTAGTASEVTGNAVMVLADGSNKMAVVSPFIYPRAAIVDPALTDSVPAQVTAATGMDTFCHATESFISLNATSHTRMYAADAMRRVMQNLPRAVAKGGDAEARDQMAYACLMAGYTLANAGTIIVHAMAHTIGAWAKIPHGVANTLCLLPVMRFCAERVPNLMAGIAEPLGVPDTVAGDEARARAAVDRMVELVDQVGLPTQLSNAGVKRAWLPDVARIAAGTKRLMRQSPVQATEAELLEMLEAVY